MTERKHIGDGHPRKPTSDDIRMGTVLRMTDKNGAVSPFSDSVVIGIETSDKHGNKQTHETMALAMAFVKKEFEGATASNVGTHDYKTIVHIARPYLYASSIGICFNWLQSVEEYSVNPHHVLENYHVVEMSTGEVAIFNHKHFPE